MTIETIRFEVGSHGWRATEAVCEYGYQLAMKVRAGELNVSVVEGLVEGYISQPAYSLMNKMELMRQGMKFL